MNELKLVSPLLDNMQLERLISDTGGAQVYLVTNTVTERPYIVKHISIPTSQTQVEALVFSGAVPDEAAAQVYYEQVVEDYKQELLTLSELSGSSSIARYLSCQVEKKETGTGFDLYLLSDFYESLASYLSKNAMTHLRVLNLGIDLCTALTELRRHQLVHRDIKPENVFLNGLNSFMLGDLGIVRLEDLKYSSMPETMISEYSAPELSDITAPLNATIDIYSVGMILYRILNGNHGPFEDEKTSAKAATKRRLTGEALPVPLYADYELAEIILKACAFEPSARYQSPDELMQDLISYMKRNNVSDTLIVPPLVMDEAVTLTEPELDSTPEPVAFTDVDQLDEKFIQNFTPDTQGADAVLKHPETVHEPQAGQSGAPTPNQELVADSADAAESEESSGETAATSAQSSASASSAPDKVTSKKGSKRWIPALISIILAAAILVAAYFAFFYHGTLSVEAVSVIKTGTTTITASLTTDDETHPLSLVCTDAYGNQQTLAFTGEPVTFTELVPGAQYKITVVATDGASVTGNSYVMVTTTATTEVVDFTASSTSIGKADLNLVLSGATPEQWTVKYHAAGSDEKVLTFSGNTVTVENLQPDTEYVFELQKPEGVEMTGKTSVTFRTAAEVEIQDLKMSELTATSIAVSWSTDSQSQPENWTVSCTGTDGFSKSLTVTEMAAGFSELTTGVTYTISVTSSATLSPAVISATPANLTISNLTAAATDAGTVELSWDASTSGEFLVSYAVDGTSSLSSLVNTAQTSLSITQLIPDTSYTFTVMSPSGEPLNGQTTVSATTPEADKFTSYGCNSVYMGLFLGPEKENWTYLDLAVIRKEFAKTETVAFAIEAITPLYSSNDEILITYVVKDADGTPVDYYTGSGEWNSLWNNKLYVGELLRTPQEAGEYSITVYFNNQLLTTSTFTVT